MRFEPLEWSLLLRVYESVHGVPMRGLFRIQRAPVVALLPSGRTRQGVVFLVLTRAGIGPS